METVKSWTELIWVELNWKSFDKFDFLTKHWNISIWKSNFELKFSIKTECFKPKSFRLLTTYDLAQLSTVPHANQILKVMRYWRAANKLFRSTVVLRLHDWTCSFLGSSICVRTSGRTWWHRPPTSRQKRRRERRGIGTPLYFTFAFVQFNEFFLMMFSLFSLWLVRNCGVFDRTCFLQRSETSACLLNWLLCVFQLFKFALNYHEINRLIKKLHSTTHETHWIFVWIFNFDVLQFR